MGSSNCPGHGNFLEEPICYRGPTSIVFSDTIPISVQFERGKDGIILGEADVQRFCCTT